MNAPAFQFYVQDFLTGTIDMNDAEIGAYLLLLCHQWDKGSLPNDDQHLRKIGRTKLRIIDKVKMKFELGEDGRLRNRRMEKERERLAEYREKMVEAGKRSGQSRRAKLEPGSKEAPARLNTSTSISTSTSFSISKENCVNKNIRVGNQQYDTTASQLIRHHYQAGIDELMSNRFRQLDVADVYAEIDLECPSGTMFTNEQHLLNKFKSIATTLLDRKTKPTGTNRFTTPDQISMSTRLPIKNL